MPPEAAVPRCDRFEQLVALLCTTFDGGAVDVLELAADPLRGGLLLEVAGLRALDRAGRLATLRDALGAPSTAAEARACLLQACRREPAWFVPVLVGCLPAPLREPPEARCALAAASAHDALRAYARRAMVSNAAPRSA